MTKENKKLVSEALNDADNIRNTIKEECKSTINSMLKEAIKDATREMADDEDDDAYELIEKDAADVEADDEKEKEADSKEEESKDEESKEDAESEKESDEKDKTEDGWSEFEEYKVGDDTYDLTGAKDGETPMKVWKLASEDDNIVIRKDEDKVEIKDNETGAEYLIDLGDSDESEQGIKESIDEDILDSEIAGLPDSETEPEESSKDYTFIDDEGETETPEGEDEFEFTTDEIEPVEESVKIKGKNCKTMKENKEIVLEVDLGYTDDYQKSDAIEGLSNEEPSEFETLDAGVPQGTEKPWAGEDIEGEPFEEPVNEEEEMLLDGDAEEEPVEEGTNVTLPNVRKKVKSHSPAFKMGPKVAHHDSKAGEYKAVAESIAKKAEAILEENKKLKEGILKIKDSLNEAYLVNVSLGKMLKLVTENTVTQQEKQQIVERFSKVENISEANSLYESIKHELNESASAKGINIESPVSSANASQMNENIVYKSQDYLKTIDLMKKICKF